MTAARSTWGLFPWYFGTSRFGFEDYHIPGLKTLAFNSVITSTLAFNSGISGHAFTSSCVKSLAFNSTIGGPT